MECGEKQTVTDVDVLRYLYAESEMRKSFQEAGKLRWPLGGFREAWLITGFALGWNARRKSGEPWSELLTERDELMHALHHHTDCNEAKDLKRKLFDEIARADGNYQMFDIASTSENRYRRLYHEAKHGEGCVCDLRDE